MKLKAMGGNKVLGLYWKCPKCEFTLTSKESKSLNDFHNIVGEHRSKHIIKEDFESMEIKA